MSLTKEQTEIRNQIIALLYQQLEKYQAEELLARIDKCLSLSFDRPVMKPLPSDAEIVDALNILTPQSKPFYIEQRIYGAKWMLGELRKRGNVS